MKSSAPQEEVDNMEKYREQILKFIEEHKEEMLGKLEQAVRMESFFDETEHVQAYMNWIKAEYEAAGFDCRILETEGGSGHAGVLTGILGAERPGKSVLFSGHLDTVHPFGSFENVWKEEEGKLYGPGVLDMKGGVIIALYVAKALESIGFNERPVKFVYVGDEECDHVNSNADKILMENAAGSICAFNMETALPDHYICVKRKSLYNVWAKVYGVGGHSGNFFEKGRNAVTEASWKVLKMSELTDLSKGITVNASIIKGGQTQAKIPDYCEIAFDARYSTAEDGRKLYQDIRNIMDTNYVDGTHTEAVIEVPGFQPFEDTPEIYRLLDFVNGIAKENGLPELKPIKLGACSDAGNVESAGVPVLDGCGIIGEFNHSLKEYAVKESMYERVLLWAMTVLSLRAFE